MIRRLLAGFIAVYGQARIWYACRATEACCRSVFRLCIRNTRRRTGPLGSLALRFGNSAPGSRYREARPILLTLGRCLPSCWFRWESFCCAATTTRDRKRAFRVPFVPWFPLLSVVLFCGGLMFGLTLITWLRFVIWLALGLIIYIFYSRHHSEFRKKQVRSQKLECRGDESFVEGYGLLLHLTSSF